MRSRVGKLTVEIQAESLVDSLIEAYRGGEARGRIIRRCYEELSGLLSWDGGKELIKEFLARAPGAEPTRARMRGRAIRRRLSSVPAKSYNRARTLR